MDQVVAALPDEQQQRLAVLSVFPSHFDAVAVEGVMEPNEAFQVADDIEALVQQGLVVRRSSAPHSTWCLQPAVQAAARALLPPPDQQRLQVAFTVHVLEQLDEWDDLYRSSPQAALAAARALSADIDAAFAWLSTCESLPLDTIAWIGWQICRSSQLCCQGLLLWRDPHYLATVHRFHDVATRLQSRRLSTAGVMSALAACHSARGLQDEAEALLRRALLLHTQLLGDAHPEVLSCTCSLAAWLQSVDREAAAVRVYLQALRLSVALRRASDPDTASILSGMAVSLLGQGLSQEAQSALDLALEIRAQQLGWDHPATVRSIALLAHCFSMQGRFVQAVRVYGRAVAASTGLLGAEHPDTLLYTHNLLVSMNNATGQQRAAAAAQGGGVRRVWWPDSAITW